MPPAIKAGYWWVGTSLEAVARCGASLLSGTFVPVPSPSEPGCCTRPPLRTHRADFPQWAPQSAFTELTSLDRWVQRVPRWQRQFEPFAAGQIAPVEPMTLALLA